MRRKVRARFRTFAFLLILGNEFDHKAQALGKHGMTQDRIILLYRLVSATLVVGGTLLLALLKGTVIGIIADVMVVIGCILWSVIYQVTLDRRLDEQYHQHRRQ